VTVGIGYFLFAALRFSLMVSHARIIFLSAAEPLWLRWVRLDPPSFDLEDFTSTHRVAEPPLVFDFSSPPLPEEPFLELIIAP
jgi:hypothetical protein